MSGSVGTNSGRGSGTIGTASAGADTSLSNLATAGERKSIVAWAHFNGTGTVAFKDSLNMTSLTDHGTGDYTLTFSITFADINYMQLTGSNADWVMVTGDTNGNYQAPTTTYTRFTVQTYNTATIDPFTCCIAYIGEVA